VYPKLLLESSLKGANREDQRKILKTLKSAKHCNMALGRLLDGAKYSHGVWEQFADIFEKVVFYMLLLCIEFIWLPYMCLYSFILIYIYIP